MKLKGKPGLRTMKSTRLLKVVQELFEQPGSLCFCFYCI